MVLEMDRLSIRIQQLKKELSQTVEETGLNSQETLKCSQKLDQLIITYQKCSRYYQSTSIYQLDETVRTVF